jgi:hypothetical protein
MFFKITIKIEGYDLIRTLIRLLGLQSCDHSFINSIKSATCLLMRDQNA